jgi:aspartate carbamoyltransferase regulatory subunit
MTWQPAKGASRQERNAQDMILIPVSKLLIKKIIMGQIRKELKVSAIEHGTVIDHIPASAVFQVIRILKLDAFDNMVMVGTNLESKKYGTKGIIKVSNKYFKAEDLNKISLVAPYASVIEIHDFEVTSKKIVEIPDEVRGIVKCFKPTSNNCVTNVDQPQLCLKPTSNR